MQDEIDEILRLVAHPLELRYKLLTGQCKLILNSSLLYRINKVLDVIVSDSVDIILTEKQRKGLQLLLNIFNNVLKLAVTQRSTESFEHVINFSKFKRLRHLELTRICLDLVAGLDSLKTQLETFICNRCTKYNGVICKLKELEWPELKFFDLRFMKLDLTTPRFFINKPWIQVLDLSFNRLTRIDGLEHLEHLTFVNFSFNHLKTIPIFSEDAQKKIEVLIMNNNYLSSLEGVQPLSVLKFLDVNFNFISNKTDYLLLCHLKSLCSLNLSNNPVSFIKYSNIYLASCLAKEINSEKFILNNKLLSGLEIKVVGKKFINCHMKHPEVNEQPSTSKGQITEDVTAETRSKYVRPGKRLKTARNVEIEEATSDGKLKEAPLKSLKEEEKFAPPILTPSLPLETSPEKEKELMDKLADLEIKSKSIQNEQEDIFHVEENESNNISVQINDQNCQNLSDVETTTIIISATVHAADASSTGTRDTDDFIEDNVLNTQELDPIVQNTYDGITSEATKVASNIISNVQDTQNDIDSSIELSNSNHENLANPTAEIKLDVLLANMDNTINMALTKLKENSDRESHTESENELSDIEEDEVFWQVQSVNRDNGKIKNIILVLLDNELKERSTENSRTINSWPLHKIQSCSKTKIDPVTIEVEFDTPKKDKQLRTYIMEFPDAQVLLKKVYAVLESKTLSSMNQKTYECIKCNSFFVRSAPSLFKNRDLISCTVCSSTLVIEVEEPKPPQLHPPSLPQISHSSSQSSIGKNINFGEEAAWEKRDSSRSAGSLDHNIVERRPSLATQRYESDIEVISNPSQSSIEVLGEHSRSVTPKRKISFEEKGIVAPNHSQLSTVLEIQSPFANLTESSSSGSLTESVLTAYEGFQNNNRKSLISEVILAEEESSPVAGPEPLSESIEEERPTSVWRKEVDIYSFTNFTDVDPRILLFLYQQLFKDDNEALLLLVKCHLWKTGGADYDGCVVFSTTKVYFLSHSRTNFKEDTCDWLTLYDSFHIKDIKEIIPLIWHQGAQVQFKNFYYLILIMEKGRTSNLFKHMRGFLVGVKVLNSINRNAELSLQQAVLESPIEALQDPSVTSFTLTQSVTIFKDDVETDILRLGGFILTPSAFFVLAGDLSWFAVSVVPSIVLAQLISNLIEVEKGKDSVVLHFLDEKEAVEEVWRLKLMSEDHVSFVVDSIRTPWEQMFSARLDVTLRS